MTIEHPRQFPELAEFVDVRLDIVEFLERTPERSGRVQRVEFADPCWHGTWMTGKITSMQAWGVWAAWIASQRGGMMDFRAGDPSRRRPLAHPRGISGWDGEGQLASLNANVLGINGLPPTLQLSEGDHLALREDGNFGLHMVLEAVGATSRGFAAVSVTPPVLTNVFTTAAVVDFHDPRALFSLDVDSVDMPKSAAERLPLRFAATQVLYR